MKEKRFEGKHYPGNVISQCYFTTIDSRAVYKTQTHKLEPHWYICWPLSWANIGLAHIVSGIPQNKSKFWEYNTGKRCLGSFLINTFRVYCFSPQNVFRRSLLLSCWISGLHHVSLSELFRGIFTINVCVSPDLNCSGILASAPKKSVGLQQDYKSPSRASWSAETFLFSTVRNSTKPVKARGGKGEPISIHGLARACLPSEVSTAFSCSLHCTPFPHIITLWVTKRDKICQLQIHCKLCFLKKKQPQPLCVGKPEGGDESLTMAKHSSALGVNVHLSVWLLHNN